AVGEVTAEVGDVPGSQEPISARDVEAGVTLFRLPHQTGAPAGAPAIALVEDAVVIPYGSLHHRHRRVSRHDGSRDLERAVPFVPHLRAKNRIPRQGIFVLAVSAVDIGGELEATVGLGAGTQTASPLAGVVLLAPDR